MAALTADRDTPTSYSERVKPLKVKAAANIRIGALVAVDATGYALPASDTAGQVVGINTMIAGGLALAIPINDVRRFVASTVPSAT